MYAINTTSWGGTAPNGREFNYIPEQLIDLPDDMAQDRIAAGYMRAATPEEIAAKRKDMVVHPGWAGTKEPNPPKGGGDTGGGKPDKGGKS
jgi:hypothetical protein